MPASYPAETPSDHPPRGTRPSDVARSGDVACPRAVGRPSGMPGTFLGLSPTNLRVSVGVAAWLAEQPDLPAQLRNVIKDT